MNRSDARAGRRVHVVYLEQGFGYQLPDGIDRSAVANRSPTGMGSLVAPCAGSDGLLWYVRYSNMRVVLHSLDELEVTPPEGGLRNGWRRSDSQREAHERLEEEAQEYRQSERDRLIRELEQAEAAREQERRDEEEQELVREVASLERRIENLQVQLGAVSARLLALRENRRRAHAPPPPAPPPPPPFKLPDEVGERHLDI